LSRISVEQGHKAFVVLKNYNKKEKKAVTYLYTELLEIVLQNCINDFPYD